MYFQTIAILRKGFHTIQSSYIFGFHYLRSDYVLKQSFSVIDILLQLKFQSIRLLNFQSIYQLLLEFDKNTLLL
jgi:hypothetical protein